MKGSEVKKGALFSKCLQMPELWRGEESLSANNQTDSKNVFVLDVGSLIEASCGVEECRPGLLMAGFYKADLSSKHCESINCSVCEEKHYLWSVQK